MLELSFGKTLEVECLNEEGVDEISGMPCTNGKLVLAKNCYYLLTTCKMEQDPHLVAISVPRHLSDRISPAFSALHRPEGQIFTKWNGNIAVSDGMTIDIPEEFSSRDAPGLPMRVRDRK